MYYHAIVETTEKNRKGCYERHYVMDSENSEDIIDDIVFPYSKNEKIYIDGMYIDTENIRSLKIKSSEKPLAELCDIAQRTVGPRFLFVYTALSILNSDNYVTDITRSTLKSVGEILKSNPGNTTSVQTDKDKVFIVHGRDENSKAVVARFVEKLGLSAIILHEQVNSGKTIIEKIEEYTNVGFAIVLYTPCDIGGIVDAQTMNPRARQNVVFEHGYLVGKLGRNNVCALVKDNIETPSDINGIVYIQLDSHDAWQLKVSREMQNSGYFIDFNKLI